MSNTNQNLKPIFKKQMRHGIAVAVFETLNDDRVIRSVNLQKSYRKGDSWIRKTIYLDHENIPFMIEALKSTWDFLNENNVRNDASDLSDTNSNSQVAAQ